MLIHPQFDPIAFSIGPLGVHWYGLMYLLGFLAFWLLGRRRAQDYWRGVTPDDVENLLFWGVFQIFSVWQGGMSAHGGLLGVLIVMALYVRRHGMRFWQLTDFVAPLVPLGLFFGRIGNFINGELWGRPASPDLPWAMIFPQAQDGGISRHPSQLYEAGLEGLALFVVIWLYSRKPRPVGRTAALFALGYGAARFVSEYFREPDAFLGLQALGLSRGQWLTLPLILAGLTLWVWAGRRRT